MEGIRVDREAKDEVCIEVRPAGSRRATAARLPCGCPWPCTPCSPACCDPARAVHAALCCSIRAACPRQVDYRWAGDANIFLAIELPAGGSATRMVPKVSNLAVRWGRCP